MRAGTRRLPPLFWQAIFILLPVTVLSVVSLISLRRDERMVEQDARNRAVEDSESLAWAMRASVNDQLQRFLTLQDEWTVEMRAAGQAPVTGVFPEDKLKSDIAKWDWDYPDLKIADVAAAHDEIVTDGQQILPPEMAAAPTPPEWFRVLSPRQLTLWARLKYAIDAGESDQIRLPDSVHIPSYKEWLREVKHVNTTNLFGAFLDTDPPFEAAYAATLMQTSLKSPPIDSGEATDSGLTFGEIACYRMLSAVDPTLTESLIDSVSWQVIFHPSFISAHLLQLAEGLTNHVDPVLGREVFCLHQYWNEQSLARAWLPPIRQLPALTNWGTPWAVWVNKSDSSALAFFQPCHFSDIPVTGPAAVSVSGPSTCLIRPTQANVWNQVVPTSISTGPGYEVSFVPCEVVQAIFTRALQENRVFIPDYETAEVTADGEPVAASFPLPHGRGSVEGTNQASVPSNWQLLATASHSVGTVDLPDTVAFSVNLYLTSREQLLSAERRHLRLFVMLILGAIFSALAALVASWRAFNRQQELNELKTNFVSSVSHELRAPIASVRLMAENLERGKIPEASRQSEYFRFIVQECRRLSSLIENVLDFSRIEQGRKQYEFEPANLVALVQTTVKLMEPYAAEKGVRLEIADMGVSSIELEVDTRAIQQALVNLIDNAIKHSPRGETVVVGIEIQETRGNSRADRLLTRAALFVADHGPGIPQEEHQKIFERFYRRGSELRRETQGVGIGLSVVQHIVEAHGGRVRVESEPGKGSRFVIELPITKNE